MPQACGDGIDDDRLEAPHADRLEPVGCEGPVGNPYSAARFATLYAA